MLQNKFQLKQTVVVMHGRKLVEMVVNSIYSGADDELVYELAYDIKPKKAKKGGDLLTASFNDVITKSFHNSCFPSAIMQKGVAAAPSRANYIVVDDLDGKMPKVVTSFHDYKEGEIFADFDAFVAGVKLVKLFVPKPKKDKATV